MNTVANVARKSLINKKINKLTILAIYKHKSYLKCTCLCECGKIKHNIRVNHIKGNKIKTCGCILGKREKIGFRICSTCGIEKELSEFHFCKKGKLGKTRVCKLCASSFKKEYTKNNRKKIAESKRKYYINNKIFYIWRGILATSLKTMGLKKQFKTINILGYSPKELKNHLESLWTDGMSWENYGYNKITGELGWSVDHIKPISKFDKQTDPKEINSLKNLRPMWLTSRIINGVFYQGNMNKGSKYYETK